MSFSHRWGCRTTLCTELSSIFHTLVCRSCPSSPVSIETPHLSVLISFAVPPCLIGLHVRVPNLTYLNTMLLVCQCCGLCTRLCCTCPLGLHAPMQSCHMMKPATRAMNRNVPEYRCYNPNCKKVQFGFLYYNDMSMYICACTC